MYEQEEPKVRSDDSKRIVVLCEVLAEIVEKAHNTLTEFEAKISPILHQEPPSPLRDVVKSAVTDESSVVLQRLTGVEARLTDLIDRVNGLYNRSEV